MSAGRTVERMLGSISGLRVLVVGDVMLDDYLEGAAARLCPEAPAPVVSVTQRQALPGGAANTALNAWALGASTELLSVLGKDEDGALLADAVDRRGVATCLLHDPGRSTLAKRRVQSGSQLIVRLDTGTGRAIPRRLERELLERMDGALERCDAVVVSDYGYGVMTGRVISALAELRSPRRPVLVVDAKELRRYRATGPTAVKPNYEQAVRLVGGRPLDGSDARALWVETNARRILRASGARIAAVTLGAGGAVTVEPGRDPYRTYAGPALDCHTVGAGDTFTAAFALALAAGADAPSAAELGSAAAALVVGKPRTALCSADELRRRANEGGKVLAGTAALPEVLARHRSLGARVVLTNGCFDILHRGHITYLNQAKALGDVLVVGVNSDESVARLKGPGRPINSLRDRADVLAALSCVDYVVPFAEETPDRLIEAATPDLFVKGGDYTREMLPEAHLVERSGGSVRILPYVADRSTSGVIEQIRAVPTSAVAVRDQP